MHVRLANLALIALLALLALSAVACEGGDVTPEDAVDGGVPVEEGDAPAGGAEGLDDPGDQLDEPEREGQLVEPEERGASRRLRAAVQDDGVAMRTTARSSTSSGGTSALLIVRSASASVR